jgi:DNA-binding response OmpR family regulator
MPGMDGFQLCKELRKRSESLGIIMLTARTQEMDKVSGLMLGADDYITKPFSPSELLARVDSLYRRVEMNRSKAVSEGDEIKLDEFVLNLRRRTLCKNGEPIELTQVEFQIVEYFFQNPDTALDRNDILTRVWGARYFGEEKIVDVNIRRLRMKIEDDPSKPTRLVTVWGMGYKWSTNE